MPKRSLRPTMRDVARLAGVSPMTVSRVQAGSSRVAPETRDRIRRAIEQLGYVDDKVAAALSSRRTGFIATLVPTLTNSTFADTAHGLSEALRRTGYQLLIGYTLYRMGEEEALVRAMLERRPEAIVLAGMSHTEAARAMLRSAGIPVVEIWDCGAAAPIDRAVGFSNIEAGRAAARHLIALGHRRIGAIGGPERFWSANARLDGYRTALMRSGLPVDEELVVRGEFAVSDGRDRARLLLDRPDPPTAIVAGNDNQAFGVLQALGERGLRVPDEVSLVGFDDAVAAWATPPLTTIRQPLAAMTAAGLRMLRMDADGAAAQPEHVELATSLAVRDSTAPPRIP